MFTEDDEYDRSTFVSIHTPSLFFDSKSFQPSYRSSHKIQIYMWEIPQKNIAMICFRTWKLLLSMNNVKCFKYERKGNISSCEVTIYT